MLANPILHLVVIELEQCDECGSAPNHKEIADAVHWQGSVQVFELLIELSVLKELFKCRSKLPVQNGHSDCKQKELDHLDRQDLDGFHRDEEVDTESDDYDGPRAQSNLVIAIQLIDVFLLFKAEALQRSQVHVQLWQDPGMGWADKQRTEHASDTEYYNFFREEGSPVERYHDGHARDKIWEGQRIEHHHHQAFALGSDDQILHEDVK